MVCGEAMTWFFLRGMMRESGHWYGFLEKFQKTFPDAKIVTLDLPGSGSHCQLHCPDSIPELVEFLRKDFKREAGEKNYIFTLSLGAMCAADWMEKYPNDFSGAVLMNTSFGNLSPFYRRIRFHNMFRFLRLFFSRNLLTREKIILQLTSSRHLKNTALAEDWSKIQKERPISFWTSMAQTIAATRFCGPLKAPIQNILLLGSANDRLVHSSCTEKIGEAWKIPVHSHPTAGHDLTLDEADWVIAQVKTWLK
jgi:alpha-beta hydrolase superfamily lysophospholipase